MTVQFGATRSADDLDAAALATLRANVAAAAGTTEDKVTVTVAGPALVTLVIETSSPSHAIAMKASLDAQLASPAAATAVLGVEVDDTPRTWVGDRSSDEATAGG